MLSKSVQFDPKTQQRVAVIEEVRWNNIALDRCPVNKSVSEINTAPIGVFAKSLGGFVMAKTLRPVTAPTRQRSLVAGPCAPKACTELQPTTGTSATNSPAPSKTECR